MAELTGTLISHITSFEGSLGSKATWGLIDGDINNQEDLIQELDLKADASSLNEHIEDNNNPHNVSKEQLGLSNVDNTSDVNKPISNATQLALNQKVSDVKVNGQSVVTDNIADVTIPTLTSDLVNDSGFISEADFSHNLQDGDNNSIHQINATNIGDNSVAYGTSTSGSKAFSVSQLKSDKKTFVFGSTTGIEVGMQGNLYIYDGTNDTNYMMFGKVESINGNEVTFNNTISWSGGLSLQDSYIWFTNHPELGNVIIGSGAVAEGYNTNATQVGSHSEGLDTIALGKYSHAEGRDSIAGGYCSHVEGRQTYTEGLYSHAEGRETIAKGTCSHAEGYKCEANGNYSSAKGRENIANGDYADVSGQGNIASGYASSASGTGTKATGNRAKADGYNCEANGTTSYAGGASSKANHTTSFVHGTRVTSSRNEQVVFGRDNADNSNALLIIGDGANENNKHNAFEVLANDVKSNGISLERKSNKVTSIDDTSTNTQYPSAKAVYDKVLPLEIATNDLQAQIDLKADNDTVEELKSSSIVRKAYHNPVIPIGENEENDSFADPTIWAGDDGYWYATATAFRRKIMRSNDLINWEYSGNRNITIAAQTSLRNMGYTLMWAPQVIKINGVYRMYFALVNSAGTKTAIACTTAVSPTGYFENPVILFTSEDTGIKDCIDPFVAYRGDGNDLKMFFGSTGGIYYTSLSPDGLSLASGATFSLIAGKTLEQDPTRETVYEGAMYYKRGLYHYLFVSAGDTEFNTYKLAVGRNSTSIGTDYKGKTGVSLKNGGATVILSAQTTSGANGPGHCSEIITDADGRTFIFYHAHPSYSSSAEPHRAMFIQEILWDEDGWPYFENNTISMEGEAPLYPHLTSKEVNFGFNVEMIDLNEFSVYDDPINTIPRHKPGIFQKVKNAVSNNKVIAICNFEWANDVGVYVFNIPTIVAGRTYKQGNCYHTNNLVNGYWLHFTCANDEGFTTGEVFITEDDYIDEIKINR